MTSGASGRLDELVRAVGDDRARPLPPVENWNPPDCGEIDIVIDREGVWHHEGRPIRRPALVRLFASVLKREGERHVLVTPVEKLGIRVEDAPFLAVEMNVETGASGTRLVFRTNMDDLVACDEEHPLRVETAADGTPRPYIYVRRGLWARLTRPVFLELAERAEERIEGGQASFGVASGGAFFALAPAGTVKESL
ncbi:DUF1285 domain-containing protein [Starkeya koreensis]|uniref:DUF1285 domain-containing protein n=1 Tax=Ancylobacter koreensis TaxID=266121 RepID=A0ABT0DQ91_9HYPH|nr:DUF1285 domain-containing protein [Ancylobacter koreensis]MCK0209364.1 DUF1285 domain-containing protein [Ancylobacter koreensis]